MTNISPKKEHLKSIAKRLKVILIFAVTFNYCGYSQNKISGIKAVKPEVIFVDGGWLDVGSVDKPNKINVKGFWIGKYEVTVKQYNAFCIATGRKIPKRSDFTAQGIVDDYFPIRGISYVDAVAYCNWLTDEYGGNWKLPTQEEWLFAATGGVKSKGYLFSGSNNIADVAIYNDNKPHTKLNTAGVYRVGSKKGNELGLHDMTGNVWEWCLGNINEYRNVIRGGGGLSYSSKCNVSTTHALSETKGNSPEVGFRVLFVEN